MKKKTTSCLLALCSVLVIASGCAKTPNKEVHIYTEYPFYDTVEKAKDAASVIIEGKIVSSETVALNPTETLTNEQKKDPKLNPGGETVSTSFPYTIYTVEINQVYKGDVTVGNTIEMKQPGGVMDHVRYAAEDEAQIEIGSTYILFLETYASSPASLINPIEGIYEYKDNKIIGNDKNIITLDLKDLE